MQILLGPSEVVDPDSTKIWQSLFQELDHEGMGSLVESCDEETKEKLRVLADRIEFIQRLLDFRQFLQKRKKPKEVRDLGRVSENDQVVAGDETTELHRIQVVEEIVFDGKDFTGVDYDVEALCIYLLLTCVDTIVGKVKTKEQGDWIVETWLNSNPNADCVPVKFIRKSREQYFDSWGIGRNFKRAFKEEMTEELRQRLISEFALLRLQDGKVDECSRQEWSGWGDEKKVKKLTDFLFDVRNIYTHTSHRTFMPRILVERLGATENCVLVAFASRADPTKGNLVLFLLDVVKNLIESRLLRRGGRAE